MLSSSAARFFGISVCGPFHRKAGQPRQDAWLAGHRRYGDFIVVADGLGSRSKSDLGAKIACLAFRDALALWAASPKRRPEHLGAMVDLIWAMRIPESEVAEYATTCLFASAFLDGSIVTGRLGDGLIARVVTGAPGYVDTGRDTDFGNETRALGIRHQASAWDVRLISKHRGDLNILLATDGIADDLIPGRIEEFLTWLTASYGMMDARKRHQLLRSELEHWPTPHHLDDKTMAVLFRHEDAS
jgi:serine/threonine protein phosphatase PrpC